MKKTIVLLAAIMLMTVPFLTGCGNSANDAGQADADQIQEGPSVSFDYITEGGKFTQDAGTTLENIDKRMEGVSTYHILQDGPSVYARWADDSDIATVISCNKSDGQTPVESSDEIPAGLFIGTQQPAGEVSEYTINAIVYVLQTLTADIASDDNLYDKVNGMVQEAQTMKKEVGEGGLSKGTIGDFDVTLLTQDNENGMNVYFVVNGK